ncbi:unnamed protein product [Cylicocyclus nassatus]|uniref:Uncharacterized protein n=1 Tax=Cylicocyclus nassatus TaxID=53992 RepID=A0AA36H4D0_CYLNA|nr:unnamed protein product [Cylicocyclus nassatus]
MFVHHDQIFGWCKSRQTFGVHDLALLQCHDNRHGRRLGGTHDRTTSLLLSSRTISSCTSPATSEGDIVDSR